MLILGSIQGYNKFDMFNKELNKILHIQLTDNNIIICYPDGMKGNNGIMEISKLNKDLNKRMNHYYLPSK